MDIQTLSTSTSNSSSTYDEVPGSSKKGPSSVAVAPFKVNTTQIDTIEKRFDALTKDWVRATRFKNSLSEINDSEPLKSIMAMGDVVVPLILKDLRDSPKHWFFALRVLTGADPIKKRDAGNLENMRKAWLNWAAKEGVEY